MQYVTPGLYCSKCSFHYTIQMRVRDNGDLVDPRHSLAIRVHMRGNMITMRSVHRAFVGGCHTRYKQIAIVNKFQMEELLQRFIICQREFDGAVHRVVGWVVLLLVVE